MEPTREYALSLKQPWATLLVHGLKTIEVRRWSTPRRGRVLIHAARIPDERPEAWRLVPAHLQEKTQLRGGILGCAEIVNCQTYRNLDAFCADAAAHLNEPGWFEAAGLYGFVFTKPEVLPFRKYPGWMRFFPVDPGPFQRKKKTLAP
jgi:hypothetical protein